MDELREFRRQNGLTQEALGNYLGVKKSFISKIENGLEKLPFDKFRKLLDNEMGWTTKALDQFRVEYQQPLRLSELAGTREVMKFVTQDPQMPISIARPRSSKELKNEKLYNENVFMKQQIAELQKRIDDLEKQNREYWEMLKQLIVVVDR